MGPNASIWKSKFVILWIIRKVKIYSEWDGSSPDVSFGYKAKFVRHWRLREKCRSCMWVLLCRRVNHNFCINELNSTENRLSADAALYQDKFLVLDEVSLQRRGIRGKYRWSPNCYFTTLTLADLNTIRLLWVRDREILRFSVLNENSFFWRIT